MLPWQIIFVCLVALPVALAVPYLALPLRGAWQLLPLGVVALVLAFVLRDVPVVNDVLKIIGATALGFYIAGMFETRRMLYSMAVFVALLDIYSVYAGPTGHIVQRDISRSVEAPALAHLLSAQLPVPGRWDIHLGIVDFMFFALFLAAAVNLGIVKRPLVLWAAMWAGLAVGLPLLWWFHSPIVPALPGLALALLACATILRVWGSTPKAKT